VLSLDIALLLAGAKERGELESRLKKLIAEVSTSKIPIILFIDELHTAVGTGALSTSPLHQNREKLGKKTYPLHH
jgi:ATP-dependent Clp protease ATP-binding subunit ClpA